MTTEFELIKHTKVQDFFAFMIEIRYRSPHLHTDIEIIYLLEGSLRIHTDNQTILVQAGELLVLNRCQLHEFHSDDAALLLILQFSPKTFDLFFPQINELYFHTQPIKLLHSLKSKRLLNNLLLACQTYFQERENFSLLCHGYTSFILFDLLEIAPYNYLREQEYDRLLNKLDRIKRISDYIETHYQEKILLADIAAKEGLSLPYLSRFFHEHFGLSFQDYLNFLRCEKAHYLLTHTDDSLLTISACCGFSAVRYLNQAFKHFYNFAPKDFRQLYQKQPKQVPEATQIRTSKYDQQRLFSSKESLAKLQKIMPSLVPTE